MPLEGQSVSFPLREESLNSPWIIYDSLNCSSCLGRGWPLAHTGNTVRTMNHSSEDSNAKLHASLLYLTLSTITQVCVAMGESCRKSSSELARSGTDNALIRTCLD